MTQKRKAPPAKSRAAKASAPAKRKTNIPPAKRQTKTRRDIHNILPSRADRINQKSFDTSLMLTVIILVVFGLIMVFSASAPAASAYQNNPYYYITRQGIFAVMGVIAMFAISCIDYHKYSKYALVILAVSLLLLFAVYIPGIGIVRNNARRWINIGISTLQPSEVVKVAIIIYFSYSLSIIKDNIKKV